jgi:hypothetical protein
MYYFYSFDGSGPKAHHNYLGDTLGIFVCQNQPACDQYISTLFELLNCKGEKRFKELWGLAKSGGISKTNFVAEIDRQEFQAVKATKDLLGKCDLKPEEITQSKSYTVFMQTPDNFEGYRAYRQKLSQGADQKYYEKLYDSIRKTGPQQETMPSQPDAANPAKTPANSQGSVAPVQAGDALRYIVVFGQFNNPGRYAWTNGMRLKDAIEVAGGFTDFAPPKVWLRHSDGSEDEYRRIFGQPFTNNPVLKPGDKVICQRD